MLNLLLLILSLLTACAANQSAFPTPRPPSFSPTLDAPITTGMPGYVGSPANLPPSPHKRVLPETPETRKQAGIWAVKDSDERVTPILLDVFPPTSMDAQTPWDYEVPEQCARTMLDALKRAKLLQAANALESPIKRCLAARLYSACADEWRKDVEAEGSPLAAMADMVRAVRLMNETARELQRTLCASLPRSSDADRILDATLKDLHRNRGRQ